MNSESSGSGFATGTLASYNDTPPQNASEMKAPAPSKLVQHNACLRLAKAMPMGLVSPRRDGPPAGYPGGGAHSIALRAKECSVLRFMGGLQALQARIGIMNRSCRRLPRRSTAKTGEPAGEAGFANRPHAFTGVATSLFMEASEHLKRPLFVGGLKRRPWLRFDHVAVVST